MVAGSKRTLASVIIVLFCFSAAAGLSADGNLSLELGISSLAIETREAVSNDSDYEIGDSYWGLMAAGTAAFSYKSTGSKNVKADLAFSFAEPETGLLVPSLDRAYVKARFPSFRLTAGKTRVSWGDGLVFNAGDIIFGSTDTSVDLTASEIRTETEWLTAVNIPLGSFSFIEGVAIAPETDTVAGFAVGSLQKSSGGGRFYTKAGSIKLEGGYFFDQTGDEASATDWESALHRAYVAAQGNLLADWNIAASAALPAVGDAKQTVKDELNISGGLFYLASLNSISSMTFRLEALYRPFYSWEEESWISVSEQPEYALVLYPEVGYTPTDSVSLTLRSVWSPVDASAMITAGAGWNVFEGFDLSCYAVFNAGDPDDSFAWNRADSLWSPGEDLMDSAAVIIGVNYIY
ncbi:MAG: hypothetical protein PQJ61_06315 [Spirochaetales bacterium]|uniref:Porin domain-containing protein n=1 Tax=Candidatus Thalassospirochaeta sargassi TaxID=3119039 RepID=A0AAJ1IDU1_9SPIO|nr:hypothetical protein [Spirochaetales bacterium]